MRVQHPTDLSGVDTARLADLDGNGLCAYPRRSCRWRQVADDVRGHEDLHLCCTRVGCASRAHTVACSKAGACSLAGTRTYAGASTAPCTRTYAGPNACADRTGQSNGWPTR